MNRQRIIQTELRALILGAFLGFILLLCGQNAEAATLAFNFTLASGATTSAGAYKPDGTLVRTLWRKVYYPAGTNSYTWDGKDDDGNNVPAGNYQFKIVAHNIQYVWDGAIGNSSQSQTGLSVHKSFYPMADMSISGSNAFYACGYNEGGFAFNRFNTSAPQVITNKWRWIYNPMFSRNENVAGNIYDRAWKYTATDGTRAYFAAPLSTNPSTRVEGYPGFITASNVSDSSQAPFSSGVNIALGPDSNSYLANGIYVGTQPGLSGLAVQASGSLLAAAVRPDNKVYFFDKTTGAASGSLTVTAPGRIEFAPNGDLWVTTGTSVVRYTLTASPGVWTVATTITGFTKPLDVAVHPSNNNIVMVADGGSSQQIKAYDSTGTSLWTYGTAGGYATNGATVANNKFWFNDGEYEDTFIAIQSDGSFWVGDGGNCRNLHFSSSRSYIDQIAFVPHNYTASADRNSPGRVFSEFLEFSVNYNASAGSGWTLVKNWGAGLPNAYFTGFGRGLLQPVTLSNGHTYAITYNDDPAVKKMMLVELVGSNLRVIGPLYQPAGTVTTIQPNGDLVNNSISDPNWNKFSLTGFDASFNPQWGTSTALASASNGATDPAPRCCGMGSIRTPVTSSNVLISYDQGMNNGFHLGGVALGGTSWLWRAMPAVTSNVPLDGLGSYDIGDGVSYGGNVATTSGRQIIAGYHGEFYRSQGQAGQFMHFFDNGLFLGQFGEPSIGYTAYDGAIAGFAGNGFSPEFIRASNGEYYLWVNDESSHGPQRWHLVSANNIREYSGSGTLGGSAVSVTAPAAAFPTDLAATPGTSLVGLSWTGVSGATSYTVKYSTSSGGPYTAVTGITGTSYTKTGLTNDTRYFFVVSAIVGGVESNNSDEVAARPLDTSVAVHVAGQATTIQQLLNISSTAPAAGNPAASLKGLSAYAGDLSLTEVGSKGYKLFNWSGAGSDNSNVLSPFTITKGSGWTNTEHYCMNVTVDGTGGIAGNGAGGGYGLGTNSVNSVDISVSDTNWHYLTVISPVVFNNARKFTIKLTPQSLTTPAASYSADESPGQNHIYQFVFKGNVTLTVDSTGGTDGSIQDIFLDNTTVLTAPPAPTGLTATAGNAQVTLNWTATAGATSYNVYRGTTAGGESATAIATGITGTTYTNTGLTNGTAYYYKIKAVNAAGAGAYSNEANATPVSPYASIAYATSAPTIDGTVDSVWSGATAYNVTTVVNGTTSISGNWKAMWDSSKLYLLATVTDGSLVNGTNDYNGDSVEFYVDADNSKGSTYGSNDFQYILGWGHSTITEYAHSGTTGVTYAQTNITGGYRMEFAIPWTTLGVTSVASNLVGIDVGMDDAASTSARAGQIMWHGTQNNFQNPSLFGTGILVAPAAPSAPSGLTATAGNADITLNWTATSGAASYNVYRGTTAGGESATAIATAVTGTTYTDSTLPNGTTYYYKIKAVNPGGTSGYSNEANATPSSLLDASIAHAASAPTIDGTVDSVWSGATTYNVTTVVNGSTTVTGNWKAMWDSSKLYVLATVTDSSLLNGTNDYNGDSVEFYVDADNSKSSSYGANDFQYILGWGHSTITEYAHAGTTGVTYAQTNITGGYRMEFAIPWTTLGVTPVANNQIGFDLGMDDAASTSARAGQIMWHGTDLNFLNPSLFGTGKLKP